MAGKFDTSTSDITSREGTVKIGVTLSAWLCAGFTRLVSLALKESNKAKLYVSPGRFSIAIALLITAFTFPGLRIFVSDGRYSRVRTQSRESMDLTCYY